MVQVESPVLQFLVHMATLMPRLTPTTQLPALTIKWAVEQYSPSAVVIPTITTTITMLLPLVVIM